MNSGGVVPVETPSREQGQEIRVRCQSDAATDAPSCAIQGSHWYVDSPDNRQMLNVILESKKAIFGDGVYWIEERKI